MPPRVLRLYSAMLCIHVLHVVEEAWGGFWMIAAVSGMPLFLLANAGLFCLPVAFFVGVRDGRRAAYQWAMAYAAFMAFQGIGHNVLTLVTGRYFGGFAGGVTGIGLLLVGVPLFFALRSALPARDRGRSIERPAHEEARR